MRRSSALILVLFLAVVFALPASYTEAASAKKVVKIGDITAFNGAVLVRTKGTWGKLRKVPHPVFSSDKIVTKRGRAQMKFVDGGIMRVNVDSNVSIVQRVEMKGFFTKRPVTSREINVLVGDVWFDVKVTRDRKVTFRTPSMTAAIRGTSGNISTLLDAVSSWGLSSGSAETTGTFQEIVEELIKELEVAGILPPSNPSVQKSPLMKAADKAVRSHSEAATSSAKAKDETATAKDASTDSPEEVLQASQLRAFAAVITASAAANEAASQVQATQEALLEAQRMGDTDAAAQAQANLEIAQSSLDVAREQVTATREIAEVVSETDNPAEAAAGAAQAVASSSVASASASTATAATQATIAELSGNTEAIELANKQIKATQDAVALAETQMERADEIAAQVEANPEVSLEVVVATTSAVSSASETIAAYAKFEAEVGRQAASGDTETLEKIQILAEQGATLADSAGKATEDVGELVENNDTEEAKRLIIVIDEIDEAIEEIEVIIEDIVEEYIEPDTKPDDTEPDDTSPST